MKKHIIIPLVIFILSCIAYNSNSYITEKPVECKVAGKLVIPGGYKSGGEAIMAFETVNGKAFDSPVSVYTYTKYDVGDKVTLMKSDRDLNPDISKNIITFALFMAMPISMLYIAGYLAIKLLETI